MKKPFQTLAETLGVEPDRAIEAELAKIPTTEIDFNVSPREFCQQIVNSPEFRKYLMSQVYLGTLPPAIAGRILDHAWGKPIERVEHSGSQENPIITEVRRVIVRANREEDDEDEKPVVVTH